MSLKPRPKPVRIVVAGSLNIDLVARVERLPAPGQTLAARGLSVLRGGKGANQLLAAARQRAHASIMGCVGDDAHGSAYREFLQSEGVDVSGLSVAARHDTGTALIAVDDHGENQIICCAGANARLSVSRVRENAALIRNADALLLQLEIPMPAVLEAICIATRAGVRVILNPSPLDARFPWGTVKLDTLIVNEGEAAAIFGIAPERLEASLDVLQSEGLARLQTRSVVITRGARATLCVDADAIFAVPTVPVEPVDTVGAGDTFAGVLSVYLAEGAPFAEAVRFANEAAALATLRPGAQSAIPKRQARSRTTRPL